MRRQVIGRCREDIHFVRVSISVLIFVIKNIPGTSPVPKANNARFPRFHFQHAKSRKSCERSYTITGQPRKGGTEQTNRETLSSTRHHRRTSTAKRMSIRALITDVANKICNHVTESLPRDRYDIHRNKNNKKLASGER